MFDIGFAELIIIAVVGLVVIGPERLPGAVRSLAKFIGRAKRMYGSLRSELEREIGADEIRRELYNEAILEELKQTKEQLDETINWSGESSQKQDASTALSNTEQKTGKQKNQPASRDSSTS